MASRKPRFRRVKVSYQPTERDLEIVRHVARHRFLSSQHLRRLVKGGNQGIGRRLQVLFHAGLLDRPKAQLEYFHRTGSKPLVYAMGSEGAKLLASLGEEIRFTRAEKNLNATKLFIAHTLSVADFITAVEVACRESKIVFQHVPSNGWTRPHWNVWAHYRDQHARLGVIPDATFALTHPNGETIHYCVEVDRATMPIHRHSILKTSVCRKFFAYNATWSQRLLDQKLGWKRFRVLTLTTSAERAANLRAAAADLPSGHGLFLFGHLGQLQHSSDTLNLPWQGLIDDLPVLLGMP